MADDAAYFRDRAEHCRRLARIVFDPKISAELLRISSEFEAQACELEAAQARHHQTHTTRRELVSERKA